MAKLYTVVIAREHSEHRTKKAALEAQNAVKLKKGEIAVTVSKEIEKDGGR